MGIGITFSVNLDGTITIGNEMPSRIRNKGKSLLELPSSYIVLDIETTGYSPEYDEIIEVAALKVVNDTVIDTYESLVYNKHIDDYITQLTGITTEMTKNAPKIKVVMKELMDFIKDDIIVAHNANFDVNFIYDATENKLNKEFKNNFVDTLRLSRKAYPDLKTHRLKYLSKFLELRNEPVHRALADCYSALELYQKCKIKITTENIELKPTSKSSHIKCSEIVADSNVIFDEANPLFQKTCVFTGTLEKMLRKDAMQLVVNIGGFVSETINAKTNYLVMGIQDYTRFVDGKESSKLKKATQLIEKGNDIKIISESEFYEMALDITLVDGLTG